MPGAFGYTISYAQVIAYFLPTLVLRSPIKVRQGTIAFRLEHIQSADRGAPRFTNDAVRVRLQDKSRLEILIRHALHRADVALMIRVQHIQSRNIERRVVAPS